MVRPILLGEHYLIHIIPLFLLKALLAWFMINFFPSELIDQMKQIFIWFILLACRREQNQHCVRIVVLLELVEGKLRLPKRMHQKLKNYKLLSKKRFLLKYTMYASSLCGFYCVLCCVVNWYICDSLMFPAGCISMHRWAVL